MKGFALEPGPTPLAGEPAPVCAVGSTRLPAWAGGLALVSVALCPHVWWGLLAGVCGGACWHAGVLRAPLGASRPRAPERSGDRAQHGTSYGSGHVGRYIMQAHAMCAKTSAARVLPMSAPLVTLRLCLHAALAKRRWAPGQTCALGTPATRPSGIPGQVLYCTGAPAPSGLCPPLPQSLSLFALLLSGRGLSRTLSLTRVPCIQMPCFQWFCACSCASGAAVGPGLSKDSRECIVGFACACVCHLRSVSAHPLWGLGMRLR